MIIALDIETYEYDTKENVYRPILNAQKFVLGCAMTEKKQVYYFYSPEEMFKWVMDTVEANNKRKKRTFIYGHNVEYDWYGFAKGHLLDDRIHYITDNMAITILAEKGYVIDTMNFYRMSLERVGDALKFPKLEMPQTVKHIDELKEYVTRDVEITLTAMLDLKRKIKTLGFNPRKLLTAGQLAMSSFLSYCNREKISYILLDYDKEKRMKHVVKAKHPIIVREAYRGGNNTAYQVGKFENVTLLDIVALYAKVMRDMDFPDLRSEQYISSPAIGMLEAYFKKHIGVAECKVRAPSMDYGYLPIRFGGYQMFPTDRILIGTWTFYELEEAVKLGYEIIECNWCIRWKKAAINPLSKFVQHIHDLEKKCETPEEKAPLKMMRNNLWAKFAQNRKNKDIKVVFRSEVQDFVEKGYTVTGSTDDKYIVVKTGEKYEASYINPIISIYISAIGKTYLHRFIRTVPKEDMLYCDTDSIMFKGDHLDKFPLGKEMGEFKLEEQGTAKILGEKRYYINDKVRISGLPKRNCHKGYIEEECDAVIQRIVGLGKGITTGNLDKVGTFESITMEMKAHAKNAIPLPHIIDERGIATEGEK